MATYTLSVSSTGTGDWGDIALVFSGSAGPGASASGTGTGAPSLAITTTQAHSAVAAIILDWNGVSGASRTWLTVNGTTPTAGNGYELDYTLVSGNYAVYVAYWPDTGASAGPVTVGLSAPTGMKYTVIATEVLGQAGAASPTAALAVGLSVAARPAWTDAGAALAAGVSVSATAVGYALQSATLPAGLSLAGGASLVTVTRLPVTAAMSAGAAGWIFNGPVPLTYLQYLGLGGTLTAAPGEFTTAITPASGYAYQLNVPPPDGRWLSPFSSSPVGDVRLPAPLRSVRKQHGQRTRSSYAAMGARR